MVVAVLTHYEVSPREKEDEARYWKHEFGTEYVPDEDDERHLRYGVPGEQETP